MDQDYDLALCKVPRKDKSGKDITNDKIGKGGRHRDDGTYSGPVYDIEVLKEPPKQVTPAQIQSSVKQVPQQTSRPITKNELPWWGQIFVGAAEDVMVDLVEEYAPVIRQKIEKVALDSFEKWLENRRNKKKKIKPSPKSAPITKAERLMQERASESHASSITGSQPTDVNTIQISSEFNDAYHHYSANMTSEEAKKELIDAFILQIIAFGKIQRVATANIVTPSGELCSGKVAIENIYNPAMIGQINAILAENPAFLEDWQSVLLAGILKREVIIDGKYFPIDYVELEGKLLAGSNTNN